MGVDWGVCCCKHLGCLLLLVCGITLSRAICSQCISSSHTHTHRHETITTHPPTQHTTTLANRFLVGETEDAIYVAFQGTKSAIDWLANLNFFHGHFGWHHQQQQPPPPQQQPHHHPSSRSSTSSQSSFSSTSTSSSGNSNSSSSGLKRRSSRAHIGFLKRANSAAVSISELHAVAAAAGKRLVLTGHSLGGAVAVLTTVRLLRSLAAQNAAAATQENVAAVAAAAAAAAAGLGLPSLGDVGPEPRVRCISFATPAMANSDLLQEVTAAGWDQYITNIVMPGERGALGGLGAEQQRAEAGVCGASSVLLLVVVCDSVYQPAPAS